MPARTATTAMEDELSCIGVFLALAVQAITRFILSVSVRFWHAPLLPPMNLQRLHSFGNTPLRYEPTRPLGNFLKINYYPACPEADGFRLAIQSSQWKHHTPSFTLFWTVGQGAACEIHPNPCLGLTIPPTCGRPSPRLSITQSHSRGDHKIQFDCGVSRYLGIEAATWEIHCPGATSTEVDATSAAKTSTIPTSR